MVCENSAKWKQDNREGVRENYRKQYGERSTPFNLRNARRKERDKAVGGTFTVDDIEILMKRTTRPLCESPLWRGPPRRPAITRTTSYRSSGRGAHDIQADGQLLCPNCNRRKGTKTDGSGGGALSRGREPK
jgi:hypothetical protein